MGAVDLNKPVFRSIISKRRQLKQALKLVNIELESVSLSLMHGPHIQFKLPGEYKESDVIKCIHSVLGAEFYVRKIIRSDDPLDYYRALICRKPVYIEHDNPALFL